MDLVKLFEVLISKKSWGKKELLKLNVGVSQSCIGTEDVLQTVIGTYCNLYGLHNLSNFYYNLVEYVNNSLTPSFTSEYCTSKLKEFWEGERVLGLYNTTEQEQRIINNFVNLVKVNIPDTHYYGRRLFIRSMNKSMFTTLNQLEGSNHD